MSPKEIDNEKRLEGLKMDFLEINMSVTMKIMSQKMPQTMKRRLHLQDIYRPGIHMSSNKEIMSQG